MLIIGGDGRILASSSPRLTPDEHRRVAVAASRGLNGFATIDGGIDDDGVRIYSMPLVVRGRRYFVAVACDLDSQADRLEDAAHALLFGIPLALLLASAGGYLLARKSLAPVAVMSQKARRISAETLSERIAVADERDELGHLATTLNELLARLQGAFELQRRFMADASHELRTPLAIIQGEADVALGRTDRTAAEYRESLEMIRGAAQKLTQLVQNLFLLARSDAGSYPMTQTRFYLEELVAGCVRSMRSVAAAHGVELATHLRSDLVFTADEALIHRMLLNLLDNAIKFTPPGGRVEVSAEVEGGMYVIRVRDSGVGIPAEERPHVFERFYRVDRARGSSGAGLGLPIARWIAEAHGGTLVVEEPAGNGTAFVARLPVKGSGIALYSIAAPDEGKA